MKISSGDLGRLRTQPHRANLWLSIYPPNTLMTARVTGTYNMGDAQITYYGANASYLNLYPDITVLVGTTAGQDDVGRIRMRAATGTYIVFAENAINWKSGQYLTFKDYIPVEAIYPKIIQDPNNEENVIFYKDGDIPYTNQNTIYGTFVNAGPHRAFFISSGTATSYWTASGTYNVAGSALSYAWSFEGGTPSGSTVFSPGNVTYTQPGHYKTRLRVTAANGAVDDTYRYVSVYNRPGEGTIIPALKWELQELSGSRNEGGYTASFKLFENIGEVEPNALVVIFADAWYSKTRTTIGGNAYGNSSIVFVGYILSDSIKFNYKESYVEFQVGSVTEVMKNAEGFSVSCESKATATTWFEMQEMTVPKAIYHYLRWHSTVLKTTDFQYTGDARLVQYFDTDRSSLFDAVDSFMRDGMLGSIVSDRQGKLWAEISPYGLENPFASIEQTFTFHKQDWLGEPHITERRNSDLSFIELGGIAYYGVTSNTFSALLSNAPSTTPLYHGKSDRNDGLILISQQHLNQLSGNYLAHHNTSFPEVSLSLVGAYLNLDIAPLEQMRLVIDANDTVRGKSIQATPYVIESMEWNYKSNDETFIPQVTLSQIATGTAGQTVLIPAVPDSGGYDYPSLDIPPLLGFGGSNPVGPTVNTQVVFHDGSKGFVYSSDFDSGSPKYITVNAGLTQTQYQNANWMFVTPNGAFYVGRCDTMSSGDIGTGRTRNPFIARAPYVGGTFVIVEDENTLFAKYSNFGENHGIMSCSFNALEPEKVAYVMGENGNMNIWIGLGSSFSKGAAASGVSAIHGKCGLSYGMDTWTHVGPSDDFLNPSKCWRFNKTATSLDATISVGDISELAHVRPSPSLGHLYTIGYSATEQIRQSLDNGSTWTLIGDVDYNSGRGLAFDPAGYSAMLNYGAGNRGRTSDALATVTFLPNLPFSPYYAFAYAGNGGATATTSRWVAAYSIIRFSPDFGNSWLNKEGDYLTTITAIPGIDMVFVPGVSQTHSISVGIF